MRFCLRVLLLSVLSGTVAPLHAETHFVSGTRNGLWTYAVISRNGIEYRTDEMGPITNDHLWNELTTTDRKALLSTYGWDLGSRADHFGSDPSNLMAAWINQEQGWTAAVQALQARQANKAFPTLTPVFGPGTVLELADFSCTNPEIINSADYKEASRLAMEISTDYAAGKQIYDMLVQAKWDQVSIAIKTLSEPLIKIIIDNFITGFVTHGGMEVYNGAYAAARGLVKDYYDFISSRMTPGATPPTPIELIERLEKYIADMELTANNAVAAVAQKKSRLSDLATNLKQLDQAKSAEKKSAAMIVRDALTTRASTIPGAAAVPTFVPSDPTATPLEQYNSIHDQALAYLLANVITPAAALETEKNAAVGGLVSKYYPAIGYARDPTYPGRSYAPDASDGFSRPYFKIMDIIQDVQQWLSTDIPNAITTMDKDKTTLPGAPADVNSVFDSLLPRINGLQSLALGMVRYKDYGLTDYWGRDLLSQINFASLRDFGAVVEIAATPEKRVEDLVTELTDRRAVAEEIKGALPAGIEKRKAWINSEWLRYDSLRFNFENSLSYVIAALKQLDRLHSGPYFKKDPVPLMCYADDGVTWGPLCIYRYFVDIAGIQARIASGASRAAREAARAQAVDELLRLHAEERNIIHRLEIAQNSHMNDVMEMSNFFGAIVAEYHYVNSPGSVGPIAENTIIQEFRTVTGKTMKGQYDLWHDLVPDITYYRRDDRLDGRWVRNGSTIPKSIYADWIDWDKFMRGECAPTAVDVVSGKIYEYYELLDLYRKMDVDKSKYLAMTLTEFNAFMTDTTLKIGSTPTGSYLTAFDRCGVGVWDVEYPASQLVMKTQDRLNRLNSEYRGYGTRPPSAWDVGGLVGASGSSGMAQSPVAALAVGTDGLTSIGAPGVTVLLDGYLTTSTKTASDGSFLFEWIGSGGFTLSVSGQGYQFPVPSSPLTVAQHNATANFTATETAESGYSISGKMTDSSGAVLQGISISLTSAAGEAQTVVTGADGVYRFFHVASGSWTIRPVAGEWTSSPAIRTATIPLSAAGLDFVGTAGVTGAEGVSVTLSGTGSGGVTSTPAGITCPGVCWAAFPTGTSVTLTATSQTGSVLAAWYGRCAGNTACTVPVNGAASVIAVFNSTAPPDGVAPTITAFTLPASATSLTVPLSFTAIDNVAVTGYLATTDTETPAPADPRWQPSAPASHTFSGSGLQILFGWAKDAAGNISEAQSAMVSLTPICYGLTTDASPVWVGSVSVNTGQNCTGGYTSNTGISLTANPLAWAGYSFTGWSGSGGTFSSTTANPTTFTITGNASVTAMFTIGSSPGATAFYTLAPCRFFDTRNTTGPDWASPALAPGETRLFTVGGRCSLPSSARSLSVNQTVTGQTASGELVLYRGDLSATPTASSISFQAGKTRANNGILDLAHDGSGTFKVFNNSTGSVHFILDVNGYFQ